MREIREAFFKTSAPRPCVLYARTSSRTQFDNNDSIQHQFAQMRDYAAQKGFVIVHEDSDDMTGYGAGSEHRPGFRLALQRAQEHGAVLIVLNPSRLTRWMPSAIDICKRGIEVHSVQHGKLGRTTLYRHVREAEAESRAKSEAQKLPKHRRKNGVRGKPLTRTQGIRGTVNNLLRRDDNIRAAAEHFMRIGGHLTMTHQQRADSLAAAGIMRVISAKTGRTAAWSKRAIKDTWLEILAEIELQSSP